MKKNSSYAKTVRMPKQFIRTVLFKGERVLKQLVSVETNPVQLIDIGIIWTRSS